MSMDRRFQMRGLAKWALKRAMAESEKRDVEPTIFINGKAYHVIPREEYSAMQMREKVMLSRH
jgi:hypothetical protein